jgi:hypothetical protein
MLIAISLYYDYIRKQVYVLPAINFHCMNINLKNIRSLKVDKDNYSISK